MKKQRNKQQKKQKAKKIINKILNILFFIMIFILIILINSIFWADKAYDNIKMEEIVYHLIMPLEGTDSSIINDYIIYVIPITILSFLFILFLYFTKVKNNVYLELKIKNKEFNLRILPLNKLFTFSLLFIIFIYNANSKLDFFSYLNNHLHSSTFIEENYISIDDAKITFEEKKNLIYIYLESMESTYSDIENGGAFNNNLIPELTDIANENISFSNSDKLGGAYTTVGSTYTMSALVSQTTGIPIKINGISDVNANSENILLGVKGLGNVLEKEGYNQMIMFGSSGNFAGRRAFFENHGNYTVWSLEDAINENKMTMEDKVWWGFDDSDLFNYAKEKIENLSKEDKPFNFTLLTANTHFEDGYFEDDVCENKYDDQYSNVIACSSKQIYEFIEWIKEQDFYDNTVIVISGDHLSMDSDFFENIDKNYDRTVYNAFINSAVSTENTKNRLYTTLDMFPTTLASMGAKIEGNRLGLGTNLFSDEKTLLEKYGKEYMDNELSKNSKYYNQNLISNKSKK